VAVRLQLKSAFEIASSARSRIALRKGSEMNSLTSGPVAQVLERLHQDAEATDRELVAAMMAGLEAPGVTMDKVVAKEKDYRANSSEHVERFLAVSPAYGCFLYMTARACKATRIVEFGTSMGVSTIYLATALRDNGGGHLISTELQPGKVAKARANLKAAGLDGLVDIREGDALETLGRLQDDVDLLLIDGAMTLYLPVLKLIEPRLKSGAVILAENAFEQGYLGHVREPANNYLSMSLPDQQRGNEFTIRL
jgi:predicted O-methyltransferase YrrM